jgi:hypothetical protein
VVATVELGLISIIHFPPLGFDSESKLASDSEAFSLETSDYLE